MRCYAIVLVNCDCASDTIARRWPTRWMMGPRCPGCQRILGPMQYRVEATVHALDEMDAVRRYRAIRCSNQVLSK